MGTTYSTHTGAGDTQGVGCRESPVVHDQERCATTEVNKTASSDATSITSTTAHSDARALSLRATPGSDQAGPPGSFHSLVRAGSQLMGRPPKIIRKDCAQSDDAIANALHVLLLGPKDQGYPVLAPQGEPGEGTIMTPFTVAIPEAKKYSGQARAEAIYAALLSRQPEGFGHVDSVQVHQEILHDRSAFDRSDR